MIVLKKSIVLLTTLLLLFAPLTASAESGVKIDVGKEFFTAETEDGRAKIAEITDMSNKELDNFCDSGGIIFLAVNKDNSKQIKISCLKNKFSESAENISLLSDEEIERLIPNITGISSDGCEIVDKNGQKFIRCGSSLSDSGGSFFLTQYITVASGKNYILSFYTPSEDRDFTESIFDTYDCGDFLKNEKTGGASFGVAAAAVAVFAVICFVIYTFIRDFKRNEN